MHLEYPTWTGTILDYPLMNRTRSILSPASATPPDQVLLDTPGLVHGKRRIGGVFQHAEDSHGPSFRNAGASDGDNDRSPKEFD